MSFTAIDLPKLPAPQVVVPISSADILDNMVSRFVDLAPDFEGVATSESDPTRKLFQVAAYEKTRIETRINLAAKAVMVAYATGTDLDNLGALVPLARQDGQSDESFRSQIQLAPEGFSVAGPRGGYEFHVRGADPSIADVFIDSFDLSVAGMTPAAQALQTQIFDLCAQFAALTNQPPLGHIHAYVLAGETGVLSPEIKAEALAAINDDDVRPLTDFVQVKSPTILAYTISATLTLAPGPDAEAVRVAAQIAVQTYIQSNFRLGAYITRSGISAALHVAGVIKVELLDPVADIKATGREVPICGAVNIALIDQSGGVI